MKLVTRPLALLMLLTLAACGGGSEDAATPPSGGTPGGGPGAPAATAPTISTQPAAQSVTAPAPATFSVTAAGTATLSYQWRSSSDGSSWTDIAGATGTSYDTGATTAAMDGRYFSVVVTNSAGSATSSSVKLTVTADTTPGGGTGTGPSGEFPHAANPMAIAVTPADEAIAVFDVASAANATVQVPGGAADVAVADGVTVTFGFPGDTFLEDQTLAVWKATLQGLAGQPLPFQSVAGAFVLDAADTAAPELQANNLVRITFTLTQQALDALGGQPVVFSAASDGTQLHLVPVFRNEDGSWSALVLTTAIDHLGLFGIATMSDAQAAAMADAWPSYGDFQLEAALAPVSYGQRRAGLVTQSVSPGARVRALARLGRTEAGASGDTWFADMTARLDAYYNDVVTPAMNAANAADADLMQFSEATRLLSIWERQRQLLGLEDERDAAVTPYIVGLLRRGLDKAMDDCRATPGAAATAQALGYVRQLALLGIETDTASTPVLEVCGGSKYKMSIDFNEVQTQEWVLAADSVETTAYRTEGKHNSTTTGRILVPQDGGIPTLESITLDVDSSVKNDCTEISRAWYCQDYTTAISAHDTGPEVRQCGQGFYVSYGVDRWNLDARGHFSTPQLYVRFQNSYGCGTSSFIVSTLATQVRTDRFGTTTSTSGESSTIDTTLWSGSVRLGTTSRIARSSKAITGQFVQPGSFDRSTARLTFTVTEVKGGN
ncbi:MAG: hypothetical protein QM696_07445 [Steroidobacteraceae bacterium]